MLPENLPAFENPKLVLPGIIAIQTTAFTNYETATEELEILNTQCSKFNDHLKNIPLIIICDDADFLSDQLNNFLWVTFTRSNPSHDIYGVESFTQYKHWGCKGPIIIDARIKPHHAPPVEKDRATEKNIERLFNRGGSLYNSLK